MSALRGGGAEALMPGAICSRRAARRCGERHAHLVASCLTVERLDADVPRARSPLVCLGERLTH